MMCCQDNSSSAAIFRPEDRIRIVMKGLSGQLPVSELCRREQVSTRLYYAWCLAFMEAGKRGLMDDKPASCREDAPAPCLEAYESMATSMAV